MNFGRYVIVSLHLIWDKDHRNPSFVVPSGVAASEKKQMTTSAHRVPQTTLDFVYAFLHSQNNFSDG